MTNRNFNDDDIDRLNIEWMGVTALRDSLGIALKGEQTPTYSRVLELASQLAPKLFGADSILINNYEDPKIREYKEKAEARSQLDGTAISPLELIDQDIEEYESLVNVSPNKYTLNSRLNNLRSIRQKFLKKPYSETQLIMRDVYNTARLPISDTGDNYRQFELPYGNLLRLRILHPDQPEHTTGADVIYERYFLDKEQVRLAAVQYKLWDTKTLPSGSRLKKQLKRMETALCTNGLCFLTLEQTTLEKYRFPYCAAFLRPTDRLQYIDSKLVSTGYHITVCEFNRLPGRSPKNQRLLSFKGKSLTSRAFEELFNHGMLGSRWLTYMELEELYKQHKILSADEKIIIHAQEFPTLRMTG